jgi:protein-disulfide isomerase
MTTNEIPRIITPLAIAAAIVISFHAGPGPQPVELKPGEAPTPPAAQIRSAFTAALAPGAPGYDRGDSRARVTVLEFSDFGCPYCARFAAETYPQLAREFVATGAVRWKYVPFVMGMFPNGTEAARAAECGADQGPQAFDRMHDRLFEEQDAWKRAADPERVFRAAAAAAGLDAGRFAACYASEAPDRRIRASNALADQLGVRATPTFFVNGAIVEGALPVEQFRSVLLDALRRSRQGGAR